MSECTELIKQVLLQRPEMMPAQIALELNVTEFDVVSALPDEQVSFLPLALLDEVIQSLPDWGDMTTIIMVSGSVFEFKGPFPQGKYAHGYYNIYTKGNGLHGHLKLDVINAIALISRPFRSSESYSINFFGSQGEVVFKVYLGRDKHRVLFADQVIRFKELIQRFPVN